MCFPASSLFSAHPPVSATLQEYSDHSILTAEIFSSFSTSGHLPCMICAWWHALRVSQPFFPGAPLHLGVCALALCMCCVLCVTLPLTASSLRVTCSFPQNLLQLFLNLHHSDPGCECDSRIVLEHRQNRDWRKIEGWIASVSCNFMAHVTALIRGTNLLA